MKNKLMLIMLLGILLIGNVMALDSLGTFKQNQVVRVSQVCSDATYITLSSITYPDSTTAITEINMTSLGSGEFYYNFNSTSQLGRYNVNGISDGCTNTFATYFEITPSGSSGSNNIVFFIIFFVIAYGVGLLGFFGKNQLISFIGGITMILLGIYMVSSGIIVYRDTFTVALSYITLGLGFIFMLVPAVESIQENM